MVFEQQHFAGIRVFPAMLGDPIFFHEMSDADRDCRSAFQWQQSILHYIEWRMGDTWRPLHRAGERWNHVRSHWLDVYRTCARAFSVADSRSIGLADRASSEIPAIADSATLRKPPRSERLEAAMKFAAGRRP